MPEAIRNHRCVASPLVTCAGRSRTRQSMPVAWSSSCSVPNTCSTRAKRLVRTVEDRQLVDQASQTSRIDDCRTVAEVRSSH